MRKILLVDDDVTGIAVRAALLRSVGYEVLMSARGRTGVEQLRREAVDLVVLDFHLPDMNGDAVLAEMKAIKPEVPVILLTGVLGVEESTAAQADRLMEKGHSTRLLLAAIQELTERSPV